MTTLDITRLKEAALAATPGPWKRTAGYGVSIQIADVKQHQDFATYNGDAKLLLVAESKHGRLPGRDADFIAVANPAAVLELIERLERAEERLAPAPADIPGALTIVMYMRDGDTLFSTGRHVTPETLRDFGNSALYHVRCEAARIYQDLQDHITGAMPNDPLDDVLPLPDEQAGLDTAMKATAPTSVMPLTGGGDYRPSRARVVFNDYSGTSLEGTEGSSHG